MNVTGHLNGRHELAKSAIYGRKPSSVNKVAYDWSTRTVCVWRGSGVQNTVLLMSKD